MRWIACLLTILLGGCQGVLLLEQPTAVAPPSIMPLWERYQQCLVTTDPTELVLLIDHFERVVPVEVEPPSWMKAWGYHVMSQPLRTAINPQALGAACTLRAAAVMAKAEHLTEARALYQRVIARYSTREWVYYVDRHGNIFGTRPGGLSVIASDGTLLGTIETGQPTSNVAWGEDGQTLFITGGSSVYRFRLIMGAIR